MLFRSIRDGNEVGGVESIIGIVADSHNSGLGRPTDPMMMIPIAQVTDGYNAAYANIQPLFWVVRTRGDPHLSVPAVTEQLRIASAGFPVGHIRTIDRKSTRLNSSHLGISYAVFCLKKKKTGPATHNPSDDPTIDRLLRGPDCFS